MLSLKVSISLKVSLSYMSPILFSHVICIILLSTTAIPSPKYSSSMFICCRILPFVKFTRRRLEAPYRPVLSIRLPLLSNVRPCVKAVGSCGYVCMLLL